MPTLAPRLPLSIPVPSGAPAGRNRGGPLADIAERFTVGLASATARGLIHDPNAVRAVWHDAVTAPQWMGPAMWLHADLHPANVLTANGTICGVIDGEREVDANGLG